MKTFIITNIEPIALTEKTVEVQGDCFHVDQWNLFVKRSHDVAEAVFAAGEWKRCITKKEEAAS